MLRSLRLGLLLWAGAALAAPAQETASDTLLTVDHYLDWEQVADPQISPDASQIVYTRRWVNKLEDKWESALWIERRRLAQPLPREGQRRALGARRHAHSLLGRW